MNIKGFMDKPIYFIEIIHVIFSNTLTESLINTSNFK